MTLFLLWSAARPERTPYGITFFWITFMSAVCGHLLGLLRKGFSGPSQPVVAADRFVVIAATSNTAAGAGIRWVNKCRTAAPAASSRTRPTENFEVEAFMSGLLFVVADAVDF